MAEPLTGLEITGYRQFERFSMDGLRRVNLLVGKNNSGKTALLEAVQILTMRPTVGAIYGVLKRRGEMESLSAPFRKDDDLYPSIRHLFPGHRFPGSEAGLQIHGRGRELFVGLTSKAGWNEAGFRYRNIPERLAEATLFISNEKDAIPLPINTSGLFYSGGVYPIEAPFTWFVGIDGLSRVEMAQTYDSLLLSGDEDRIVDALRILSPEVQDVHFRSAVHASGGDEGSSVLLGYGTGGRHPLGSAGEGMRRMLGLTLALSNAKGGVLLVDEIDTGLHYSVMGDLWRLVTETARRLDVQVFATTHSKDCVEGLEHMRFKSPELFEDVAVHTIDVRRGRSVVSAGERLEDAVQLGVELR